jgi:hypothetical protein
LKKYLRCSAIGVNAISGADQVLVCSAVVIGGVENDDDNDYNMTTMKANFNGMKIFDEIETCRRDSYFKLKINASYKHIHNQSACWLLTDKNMRLSNDRLSRAIQSSRKGISNLF